MRTALVLLFLLALAAVPGSVVPQANIDAVKVANWQDDHPTLTPVYEKLGLFSVFSSPWFSAIYLLLMVSLVGCFVPRLRIYWRAMRAQPPAVPRRLERLPESRRFEIDEAPAAVLERTEKALRARRYRVVATRRRDSPRRRATSARRATCCSTSRCSWCSPASRSASCSATRAASSRSSGRASATR